MKPPAFIGLCHVALKVRDLEICERFYVNLLGYAVEWRPDSDNLYLSSGRDNLALHRVDGVENTGALDHIGIVLVQAEDVDLWYEFLLSHDVRMDKPPKTHRDGARSFYCFDPEGNRIQMLYHPPIAKA